MKRFFALLAIGAISFGLSSSADAQVTRTIGAGGLILDDGLGHTITITTPQSGSQAWTNWQTAGFPNLQWSVPVPPTIGAQSGFILPGPQAVTSGPTQLPYWIYPNNPANISNTNGSPVSGGSTGTWNYATPAQLGLVTVLSGTVNTIPKFNTATSLTNSLLTDDGTTLNYNSGMFTVASATGNTLVAGTLTSAGNSTLGTSASATANSFGTAANAAAVANTIGGTFAGSTNQINGTTTYGGIVHHGANLVDGSNFVITGSTINNTTIGVTTPVAGNFTSIGVTTQGTGAFTTLTSTGGGINGTVGATTPNTGAFTTLTSSGNSTLGTAAGATANSFGTAANAAAVANTIGGTFAGSTNQINGTTTFGGTTHFGANVVDGSAFAITGSTINGTTIGVTTPVAGNFTSIGVTTQGTGAFTTLTSSGNSTIGVGVGATTNRFGTANNAAAVANTIGGTFAGSTNQINGTTTFGGTTHFGANVVDGSAFAITGSTINGTTIGVTTPAAGNFTTIGASSLGSGAFTTVSATGNITTTAGNLVSGATGGPSGKLVLWDGATHFATVDASTQAANNTYNIPDAGGAADFVMTAGLQTITAKKTFNGANTFRYTDGNQAANKILVSNASGDASWSGTPTLTSLTLSGAAPTIILTNASPGIQIPVAGTLNFTNSTPVSLATLTDVAGTGAFHNTGDLTADGQLTVNTVGGNAINIPNGGLTSGTPNATSGSLTVADGGSAFSGTIEAGLLTADRTYQLPDLALQYFALTSQQVYTDAALVQPGAIQLLVNGGGTAIQLQQTGGGADGFLNFKSAGALDLFKVGNTGNVVAADYVTATNSTSPSIISDLTGSQVLQLNSTGGAGTVGLYVGFSGAPETGAFIAGDGTAAGVGIKLQGPGGIGMDVRDFTAAGFFTSGINVEVSGTTAGNYGIQAKADNTTAATVDAVAGTGMRQHANGASADYIVTPASVIADGGSPIMAIGNADATHYSNGVTIKNGAFALAGSVQPAGKITGISASAANTLKTINNPLCTSDAIIILTPTDDDAAKAQWYVASVSDGNFIIENHTGTGVANASNVNYFIITPVTR